MGRFGKLASVPAWLSHMRSSALLAPLVLGAEGCVSEITAADTVDLGDNFEAPDFALDEDFFHCVIQPEVITKFKCAAGAAGDGDGCHAARSALRLVEATDKPRCRDDRVVGAPPSASVVNLERVRVTVAGEAARSPFYRRPLGLDSHPRKIFDEGSAGADLIRQWINQGAP
jgi:hypothetical protein